MSADLKISRRAFTGGLALLGLRGPAFAQGFAGLGGSATGFAPVVPGKTFAFPADHGVHPDFRIEWWYVTANLVDASGAACGAQWTLFRQAMGPGSERQGWASQQLWMGHAAVTTASVHRFSETFARGGVGQAGVEAWPFAAWIDAWEMRGSNQTDASTIAPLDLRASGARFSYALHLTADRPLILEGDGGYSKKSEREQASYYYSQPFLKVAGNLTIDEKPIEVSGQAWMDREWSSQPLAPDQTGWDWLALHFATGEKLMLYRMRQADGHHYASGNWILPDGTAKQIASHDIEMVPGAPVEIERHRLPVAWHIAIPSLTLSIECTPLNPRSWMGRGFSYWEGPISFAGSHGGVGYLEMTGY
jgi:predicted secreted hydrolase